MNASFTLRRRAEARPQKPVLEKDREAIMEELKFGSMNMQAICKKWHVAEGQISLFAIDLGFTMAERGERIRNEAAMARIAHEIFEDGRKADPDQPDDDEGHAPVDAGGNQSAKEHAQG